MNLFDRTHGLDFLYSLLAFLCEEELQDHPAIAADVMAAFNIVAEHHVPNALLAQASGLAARDALHRADVLARALALSATELDEHLRLLRVFDLLRTAQADLNERFAEEP